MVKNKKSLNLKPFILIKYCYLSNYRFFNKKLYSAKILLLAAIATLIGCEVSEQADVVIKPTAALPTLHLTNNNCLSVSFS